MTLEELKVEAEKLGYKLVKANKKAYISLLPCPMCGKKRTEEWIFKLEGGGHSYFRRCQNCGFDGYYGKTIKESRAAWNEAVKRYLKHYMKGENNAEN